MHTKRTGKRVRFSTTQHFAQTNSSLSGLRHSSINPTTMPIVERWNTIDNERTRTPSTRIHTTHTEIRSLAPSVSFWSSSVLECSFTRFNGGKTNDDRLRAHTMLLSFDRIMQFSDPQFAFNPRNRHYYAYREWQRLTEIKNAESKQSRGEPVTPVAAVEATEEH
jgi:hypothetical protein